MKKLFISILLTAFATLIGYAGPNPVLQNAYTTNNATVADAYVRTISRSITNGLATTNYVNVATNDLASTSYVIAATNTLIITSNQIANNTISSNKLDAVAYAAFIGGGTSTANPNALTNNETQSIALLSDVTIGGSLNAGDTALRILNGSLVTDSYVTIGGSLGVDDTALTIANGDLVVGISGRYFGNGSGLTDIHGSNSIAAGTISTNRMDPTAYAAFIGGNGSGISVTAGTNILMVTNGPGTLVTVHGTANVTQAGLAAGSYTLAGNGAGITSLAGANITAGTISSNKLDATAYAAFIGAGANALTNNWSASAPEIRITNTVNVGKMSIKEGDIRFNDVDPYTDFFILSSNQFKFNSGTGLYGAYKFIWGSQAQSYIDWGNWGNWLIRSKYIGMEVPEDGSTIRLTDDHRRDGMVKLSAQSVDGGLLYPSNNYSGMLAFQSPGVNSEAFNGQPYTPGYAGIRAKNANSQPVITMRGEGMSQSELWFYTLIPPQLNQADGGFRIVGDTNWFAIGVTNSLITKGLTISTNAISQWPLAPRSSGDMMLVNSNGYLYSLNATNNSATWNSTNLISASIPASTNFSGIIVTNDATIGNNVTIGNSLAQGQDVTASGNYSHAQGRDVIASGNYSHAEGSGTRASGQASHAEGVGNTASGTASHAEGGSTIASGDYSHAAGVYAKVREEDDYSWIWNANPVSYNSDSPFTSTAAKQFSVNAPGGIRLLGGPIYGDASGLSNIMTGSLGLGTAAYSNSEAFRLIDNTNFSGIIVTNNLSVTNDVWIGLNLKIGGNATIGSSLIQGPYNTVNGSFSHAQGFNITVDGDYSHAEGYGTTATANFTHAEGYLTEATAGGAHAEGEYSRASGTGSHAEGESTEAAGAYSHAEGYSTQAGGDHSHAEGYLSIASGQASHVQGYGTSASGFASHASGVNAYATNDYTWIWNGNNSGIFGTTAANQFAVNAPGGIRLLGSPIYGDGSGLSNITIVSLGLGTAAYSNSEAFRLINNTNFSGIIVTNNAIVGNKLTISNTLAQGLNPIASGQYSSAQGRSVTATGNYSHAQGESTTASGQSSHAEGYSTRAIGDKSHAEGNLTLAYEIGSHAEGESSKAVGLYSHAEGYDTAATNQAAHAEGYQTIATNQAAHAEGRQTTAGGDASHAEGYGTLASGLRSHAEGDSTAATNEASHAQGYATQAWGKYSHAEGASTTASNYASHAEGLGTIATGEASHAEGWLGQATGDFSHAEGYLTAASGENSHAEGYQTQANGDASHAEGFDTRANGENSHAEGYATRAEGLYSHAAGNAARATDNYTWVWASDNTIIGESTSFFTSTAERQFSVWATGGIRLLGSPIYGDGSGLTNLPPASAYYTNNSGLPGVVVGYGIGTNLSTLATVTQLSSATNAATLTASINATNAVVANLSSGLYTVSGNGAGLTNLNFSAGNYATNASALTNVIDMTKPYSAATISNTLTLTALSGVNTYATNVQWATRFYTNTGTAGAVNFPASWIGNTVGQYITNQSVISVVVYPGFGTNVIYRNLK